MPRKSKQLRLQQAKDLSTSWSDSLFSNDYRHRFIRDMITRLTQDRGLSKKQRDWLDTLIEEGVPAVENKNPELVAQIDTAIAAFAAAGSSYNWEHNVLVDMRPRVALGRQMSEKQMGLLTRLCFDGEQLAKGNVWTPDEETIKQLKYAVSLYKGYAVQWRAERPAVFRAVTDVENFLNLGDQLKAAAADKLLNAVSSKLKKVNKPRFKTGDVGKKTVTKWNPSTHRHEVVETQRLVCMSDVYVTKDGLIVNDWLLPSGEFVTLAAERVAKR